MSGVYESDRKESPCDHMALAQAIRCEVTSLMASSKVVPKSYRFLLAVPTVECARELVCNIETAELFYPSTAHGVIWRKHHLTLAIANCHHLVQDLQVVKDLGLPVNVNRYEATADMLAKEIDILKKRRHNTKLTGNRPVSERIAKLEAELEELREVEADLPGGGEGREAGKSTEG